MEGYVSCLNALCALVCMCVSMGVRMIVRQRLEFMSVVCMCVVLVRVCARVCM